MKGCAVVRGVRQTVTLPDARRHRRLHMCSSDTWSTAISRWQDFGRHEVAECGPESLVRYDRFERNYCCYAVPKHLSAHPVRPTSTQTLDKPQSHPAATAYIMSMFSSRNVWDDQGAWPLGDGLATRLRHRARATSSSHGGKRDIVNGYRINSRLPCRTSKRNISVWGV